MTPGSEQAGPPKVRGAFLARHLRAKRKELDDVAGLVFVHEQRLGEDSAQLGAGHLKGAAPDISSCQGFRRCELLGQQEGQIKDHVPRRKQIAAVATGKVGQRVIEEVFQVAALERGAFRDERGRKFRQASRSTDLDPPSWPCHRFDNRAWERALPSALHVHHLPGRLVDVRVVHEVFGFSNSARLQKLGELHVFRTP